MFTLFLSLLAFSLWRQHAVASARLTIFGFDLSDSIHDSRSFPCLLVADAPWTYRSYDDLYSMCRKLRWSAEQDSWQAGGYYSRWRPARLEDTKEDALLDVYLGPAIERADHAWALTERVAPALCLVLGFGCLLAHFLCSMCSECEDDFLPPPRPKAKVASAAAKQSTAGESSGKGLGPACDADCSGEMAAKGNAGATEGVMQEIELSGCKSRHAAEKLAAGLSGALAAA